MPLRSGGATPTSAEAVVYILRRCPMTVLIRDELNEGNIRVEPEDLPESDDDRLMFLKADPVTMRRTAGELDSGERGKAPPWYEARKALANGASPSP